MTIENSEGGHRSESESIMIVKLKKKNARYRDLTFGQPYVVIGVEADDLRILDDAGPAVLISTRLVFIGRSTRTR